ncbi:MAG: FHA domain-containing protein [Gammaproteobacteria bacterium]|nr:FHA domain-containing protein [Gammaproteobacteria bacterium]MCP5458657.1 FHA domain-containing protein [Gammaproteobacteria bacterium]
MTIEDFTYPPELRRFVHFHPEHTGPTPENLQELEQLLSEIWSKKTGKTASDQLVIEHFKELCGLGEEWVAEREQRILKQMDKKQTIELAFNAAPECRPGRPSVLTALVMNTTPWVFREIRIRFDSLDLDITEHAQPRPIKLLEGHDVLPVYLHYRAPYEAQLATLGVEVEVCDNNGEWQAYRSRHGILLSFPGQDKAPFVRVRTTGNTPSMAVFDLPRGIKGIEGGRLASMGRHAPSIEQLLPIELELESERTRVLQAKVAQVQSAANTFSGRGTTLSRALLRSLNPEQAPERIELVSRPFMVLGRYNESTDVCFGDFALGFVPGFRQISRLHCAICASGDGLAIMHASMHEGSYTGLNAQKLVFGGWQRLESGDTLDFCGLFQLHVAVSWSAELDFADDLENTHQAEELGQYLLEVVAMVKQLEKAGSGDLKNNLRTRYVNLKRLQDKAAALNGVDKPGLMLNARFYREDSAQQRILHVYLPKRISLGSSRQAGVMINAPDVVAQHAELQFKNGLYWLKNTAESGSVGIAGQGLETEETLPLTKGDEINIGSARFVFEAY